MELDGNEEDRNLITDEVMWKITQIKLEGFNARRSEECTEFLKA